MTSHRFLAVAVPTLALLLGCVPLEKWNAPAATAHVIPTDGGGGTGGAGGSKQEGGNTGSAGGAAGGGDPAGPSCTTCDAALGANDPTGLCAASQPNYDAVLECACHGACAAACATDAGSDCLAAWDGNAPLQCKVCLLSATGCGAAWSACLSDEGATGGVAKGTGRGGECGDDPAILLCPGGGACGAPGGAALPGNASCGSAEYCAPCCDPGAPHAGRGSCQATRLAESPCSAGYECCSGVCTIGKCDGGCGVVLSF